MSDAGSDFVFLLCSERSGSNFVTKLLDAHSQICGPSPTHMIRTFAPNLWRYGDLGDATNWAALCDDVADLLEHQLGIWGTACTSEELQRAAPGRSFADLVTVVYRAEAHRHDKSVVFVKENHAARLAPFLTASFPAAKYLFVVRDPRDVALSVKRSPATRGRVLDGATMWLEDQRENLSLLGSLDAGRIRRIRYEDIIADPSAELSAICTFLGVDFEPEMLDFHNNELTRENAARIDAWRNLAKPILTDNAGRYRSELSELEIRFVEALCAPEMSYFGYARDLETGPSSLDSLTADLMALEEGETALRADAVSDAESDTRTRRIEVIDRVLGRTLWTT